MAKKPSPKASTGADSIERLAADVTACRLCPRLNEYRASIGDGERPYWNRPVPSFGDARARLIIIGLAPGAHGANRTGRPFTGDYAGEWLYRALFRFGFATKEVSVASDDALRLKDAWITNAVRCVPPENKPLPAEVKSCAPYLVRELALLSRRTIVLALGKTAHDAFLTFLKSGAFPALRRADFPFMHGRLHTFPDGMRLADSYHCSRYNTSTKVLTWDMFESVFRMLKTALSE